MSRRRPRSAPPNGSLTFYQKQTALHKVKTLEKAMVSTMVPLNFDLQAICNWCFPADALAKLREALPLVDSASCRHIYPPIKIEGVSTRLALETGGIGYPAPNETLFKLPPGNLLYDAIIHMQKIVKQFNEVRMVINWMDKNASVGALRYYFPAILSLIPADKTPLFEVNGNVHKTPQGIADYVPLIRDRVSPLIVSALFLPAHADNNTIIYKATATVWFDGLSELSPNIFPLVWEI